VLRILSDVESHLGFFLEESPGESPKVRAVVGVSRQGSRRTRPQVQGEGQGEGQEGQGQEGQGQEGQGQEGQGQGQGEGEGEGEGILRPNITRRLPLTRRLLTLHPLQKREARGPTLLYSTLLYSTLLYSTLLYSTLLYSALLCSTLLYSTLLYPLHPL
jgi:hypothetical protein